MTYRGNFFKHPITPETESPAYTRTCLAQSSDLQANTGYSAILPFSRCPMRLTSNWVTERSSQYLIHLVKFTNIQPRNNNIKKQTNKQTNKKNHKKEKPKNIAILTLTTSLTSKNVKLIRNNFEPLGPHLFFSRDQFICSHTYFWGSRCDCN